MVAEKDNDVIFSAKLKGFIRIYNVKIYGFQPSNIYGFLSLKEKGIVGKECIWNPTSWQHSVFQCKLDQNKIHRLWVLLRAASPYTYPQSMFWAEKWKLPELFIWKFSFFGGKILNIWIKHGFSCINIHQVPWKVLKTEAGGRGFQHLPRDLANVNALKNHVRSLLLHKKWKHLLHFALFLALFCFAFSLMSRERNFHWLCSF